MRIFLQPMRDHSVLSPQESLTIFGQIEHFARMNKELLRHMMQARTVVPFFFLPPAHRRDDVDVLDGVLDGIGDGTDGDDGGVGGDG